MGILRIFALGVLFCFSFNLFAKPEVQTVDINGYKFIIANLKKGNQIVLEGFVKTGFFNDIKPGLSHLVEHLMHNGSKKYPGRDYLRKRMSELGSSRNAHTTSVFTRYFAYFLPEALDEAISIYGAAFHHPTFGDFLNERGTVIQEVIKEYLPRDPIVAMALPWVELLPEGHFLKKFAVGSDSDLKGMTETDARAFFESSYAPEQMTWVLTGNFDLPGSPTISEIIEKLKKSFIPPEKTIQNNTFPRTAEIVLPDLRKKDDKTSPFYIEGLAKGDTSLYAVEFWAPETITTNDMAAYDLLTAILSLDIAGSLKDALLKKQWITDLTTDSESPGGRTHLTIGFELTDLGFQNRMEITEFIFAYLYQLRVNGVPKDLLDMLKTREKSIEGIRNLSAPAFTRFLTSSLIQGVSLNNILNVEEYFAPVTPASIQSRTAALLDSSEIFITALAPEKKTELVAISEFTKTSETLGIKYRIPPTEVISKAVETGRTGQSKLSQAKWDIQKVSLNLRTEALKSASADGTRIRSDLASQNEKIILVEDHSSTNGALNLTLQFGYETQESQTYAELLGRAFQEHYKPALTYLNAIGVLRGIRANGAYLDIKLKDNAAAGIEAAQFLIDAFKNFVPTNDLIAQVLQQRISEFESQQQSFNAFQPFTDLYPITSPSQFDEREILKKLKGESIDQIRQKATDLHSRLTQQADFQLVLIGDYNLESIETLKKTIRTAFPFQFLEPRRKLKGPIQTFRFWSEMGASKSPEDFGGLRAYSSGSRSVKDVAALMVLEAVLEGETSNLNRQIQGLGYAHSATFMANNNGPFIFYGGVTGDNPSEENARDGITQYKLMTQGWDRLVNEASGVYADGQTPLIKDEEIENARKGLLAKRKKTLVQNFQIADRLSLYVAEVGVANALSAYDDETKLIEDLSIDDIRAAARKFLLNAPFIEITASKIKPEFCADALTSIAEAVKLTK